MASPNSGDQTSGPHESLRDLVLIHAGNNSLVVESGLHRLGDGLVLHGSGGAEWANSLRDLPLEGALLWDPERYLGPAAKLESTGQFGFNDEAASNQKALGVDAFLSPSTSPPKDDSDAVKKLLDSGHQFLNAATAVDETLPGFVVLALPPKWLTTWSERLVADIEDSGLPVALVLAATRDPLDQPESIRTLLEIMEVAPYVLMLRCDTSAIGAVACGALAGAIGTSSSVRHLYLPTKRSKTPNDDIGYVFVTEASNWMKRATLRQIPPDHPALICHCPVCGGRSVAQYLDDAPADRGRTDLHDFHSWSAIRNEVLAAPTRAQRTQLWREHCKAALRTYEDLQSDGIDLTLPGFLVGWAAWQM